MTANGEIAAIAKAGEGGALYWRAEGPRFERGLRGAEAANQDRVRGAEAANQDRVRGAEAANQGGVRGAEAAKQGGVAASQFLS